MVQKLFSFAVPEPLILESCETAIEQWMAGVPDTAKLRPHWDRWVAASDRLEELGVVMGEIYYPRGLRKRMRNALKDW